MNRNELTKTFMIISNWKKPLTSMVYTKVFQRFKGWIWAVYVVCITRWNGNRRRLALWVSAGSQLTSTPSPRTGSPTPLMRLLLRSDFHIPTNTSRWTNAGLMLANRLRRRPNIKTTLVSKCCFDVGPSSATLTQHQNNIWSTSLVDSQGAALLLDVYPLNTRLDLMLD